jgi:hypothetical protein
MGELIRFSMSIDPKDRGRAYVTSHGCQITFMNDGDMYAMAAEYASHLTGGALKFIRKNGKPAPVMREWNPDKWLKKNA